MSLSVIMPTIGRPTLVAAVASVRTQLQDHDELLVVHDGQTASLWDAPFLPDGRLVLASTGRRHNDYGATARNVGLMLARGQYCVFLDDDDVYTPDALALFRKAAAEEPDALHVFKMRQPSGRVVWEEPELRVNNVGTPCLCHKRLDPPVLWDAKYNHDARYAQAVCARLRWVTRFHDEIVALVGHVPDAKEAARIAREQGG